MSKQISTSMGLIAISIEIIILFGGVFTYQYFAIQKYQKINYIEAINQTTIGENYVNNEYGFRMIFPDSWKGYSVVVQNWDGHAIDNYQQTYSGPLLIIKNPKTTSQQVWQDIPIMVFTPDVWNMVDGENPTVAVSAAPIGPAKIGENSKYVFATPPRWYGFTDAVGWQEAVDIAKTFKAF
jgi:hypothetical protein